MPGALSSSTTRWHCSGCSARMSKSECSDPRAECLTCSLGHRFFLLEKPNLGQATARAAGLNLNQLTGTALEDVARFWLMDPTARAHLNDQLAELLRIFLDGRYVPLELPHQHCPTCGETLSGYEQPDIWVRGFRCTQDHIWAARGSHLGGRVEEEYVTFYAEPTDNVLSKLAEGWLNHNPHLQPQIHRSVRPILEALQSRLRSNASQETPSK